MDPVTPPEASQPRVAALLACGANLMALSWHMPVSKSPFRYAVAVREENYTHALLRTRGSCTLNFMPFEHYSTLDKMGRLHGDETDKLSLSGLATQGTDKEDNLLLEHAEFIYECRVVDTASWGDHTLFICDVTRVRVHEDPTGRLALFTGKGRYGTLSETVQVPLHDRGACSSRDFVRT